MIGARKTMDNVIYSSMSVRGSIRSMREVATGHVALRSCTDGRGDVTRPTQRQPSRVSKRQSKALWGFDSVLLASTCQSSDSALCLATEVSSEYCHGYTERLRSLGTLQILF